MFGPKQTPFPYARARELGLSEEQIAFCEAALKMFDGSYNTLIALLRENGYCDDILRAVMTIAAEEMGESRDDVDILDVDSTMAWTKGQTGTAKDLQEAKPGFDALSNLFASVTFWFNRANADRDIRRRRGRR